MESHSLVSKTTPKIWVLILCLGLVATSVYGQGTRVGFYSATCPNAEAIIKSTVESHLQSNQRIAPGLLRLSFHDCFIRGCDGSVLISGPGTERAAPQNSGINGYNVIDDAKTQLEAECPGVVSCADILQLATRDAVVATGGSSWGVPTGRRDGRVSIQSETSNLPGPNEAVSDQRSKLANIGLNDQDLVTLVGAHTIGTTSCRLINSRLFNFPNSSTGADPTIAEAFLPTLRGFCPQDGDLNRRVFLDDGSGTTFDTSFFTNVRNGRGVLRSDQLLSSDSNTQPIVDGFATGSLNFDNEFASSMIKMSNIGVLTGTDGEIRTVCSAIN